MLFATINEEAHRRGYEYHLNFPTVTETLNVFLKFRGPEDKEVKVYKYYFDSNGYIVFEKIEKLDADRFRMIFTLS